MSRAGITQAQLARRSGIRKSVVSKLVNCKAIARLDIVLRILAACGLEVTTLGVKDVTK